MLSAMSASTAEAVMTPAHACWQCFFCSFASWLLKMMPGQQETVNVCHALVSLQGGTISRQEHHFLAGNCSFRKHARCHGG